jgi:hypothetical protein
MIVVDYEKMEAKAAHLSNSEAKYENIAYAFDRMGQELNVTLPFIEFTHVESNFQEIAHIDNQ